MRPNDCTGTPAATVAAGGHLFIFNLYYGSADFGLAWLDGGWLRWMWRMWRIWMEGIKVPTSELPTRQNSDEAQVIPAVL